MEAGSRARDFLTGRCYQGRNGHCRPSSTLYSYGAVTGYVADAGASRGAGIIRENICRYNQIRAVVLGPKDLDKPHWDEDLQAKIKQMHRRA